MTEPTEEQKQFMIKHRLRPDTWLVYEETEKELVIISKRRTMRRVLKKK